MEVAVLPLCIPLICSPTGPHLLFGTWYLAIFDATRVVCVIACLVLLGQVGRAWRRSYPHGGQRDRYLALGVFAFVVIGTELENLGNIASYRLVLSAFAVTFAIRGLRRFGHEQPSTPR